MKNRLHWTDLLGKRQVVLGASAAVAMNLLGSASFNAYQSWWRGSCRTVAPLDVVFAAVSVATLLGVQAGVKRQSGSFISRILIGGTGLQWIASEVQYMAGKFIENQMRLQWNPWDLLLLMVGGALAYWAYRGLVRAGDGRLSVESKVKSQAIDGLIIFLSNPQGLSSPLDGEWGNRATLAGITGDATRRETLDKFRRENGVPLNWRMPFEAIGYHMREHPDQLLFVVVITSADAMNAQQRRVNSGTYRVFSLFLTMTERLLPERNRPQFHQLRSTGVDFDDAKEIADAIEAAKAKLRKAGCRRIVVDATGGTALCTALGAGLSFEQSQVFQYVRYVAGDPGKPGEYHIEEFNLVYESAPTATPGP